MSEEWLLTIGVECYAGHRGEQTPRTLMLGDRRIVVAEVLDAWLAPDYRYFKLRCEDGPELDRGAETPGSERTPIAGQPPTCGVVLALLELPP
jgi:hypothetical protein